MARTITIYDFMLEIASFHKFSDRDKEKAKSMSVDTNNNAQLRNLVSRWEKGDYDNDIEMVVSKIDYILYSN